MPHNNILTYQSQDLKWISEEKRERKRKEKRQ